MHKFITNSVWIRKGWSVAILIIYVHVHYVGLLHTISPNISMTNSIFTSVQEHQHNRLVVQKYYLYYIIYTKLFKQIANVCSKIKRMMFQATVLSCNDVLGCQQSGWMRSISRWTLAQMHYWSFDPCVNSAVIGLQIQPLWSC